MTRVQKIGHNTVPWFHSFTGDSALALEKIFYGLVKEWINTAITEVLNEFILAQLEKLRVMISAER